MKKSYRIKKYSEIDAIFKKKQSKSDGCFAIYTANEPNESRFRFALSIGKKYGKAVQRNKIKRQIRMIIQEHHQAIKSQSLFVIVIRPKANELAYSEIKSAIVTLLKKSKLLENTHV